MIRLNLICLVLFSLCCSTLVHAEDGYELWLRYDALEQDAREKLLPYAQTLIVSESPAATELLAQEELKKGLEGLLSVSLSYSDELIDGAIIIALANDLALLNVLRRVDVSFDELLGDALDEVGSEGFVIQSLELGGHKVTIVTANEEIGLLYGAFDLLRYFQTLTPLSDMNVVSTPAIELRLLNHWDNLDRTVERGFAGQSIWDWWRLPEVVDSRYIDYARANASVGINGTVLNNVNSKSASLTAPYIAKAAAVADVLRPYGIQVFLSARFSSPLEIGGLSVSDPLDPDVQAWWNAKAEEIYQSIPDFGGFLVKANSEGQPGPQDYGRTHADGANMLAAALAPYDGVVMWRAFVYSDVNPEDRAKQAFSEFKPLDGSFADNVIIQVKNGPIDFQPREPFHPMFGAFPDTSLMMEFQITKEYLGFDTHLAYLGPLYEEVLKTDTYSQGEGSLVADVIDGSLHGYSRTAIAGVSNIGSDRDWTGSDFNQANWYVYGRLAWNPRLSTEGIAQDWLSMTFNSNPDFITAATEMMMRSREAVVDYMTPLGLAHLMATGHHYGPGPWVSELGRPEWNPVYYHRADQGGIGFDRTETGSDAISQYAEEVAVEFSSLNNIDEKLLLWFHHVPWDYEMSSGQSLWQALIAEYDHGVAEVEAMVTTWAALDDYVDEERFIKTTKLLNIQLNEAVWWRDSGIAYFQSISGLDLPQGVRAPEYSLEYYKALDYPYAPGHH